MIVGRVSWASRNTQFSAQEREASTLFARYRQGHEVGTLRAAVDLYRVALRSEPGRSAYAHNLGGALLSLSRHDDDPAILREAVALCRAAVAQTPDRNRNKAGYLSSLAASLQLLAERADHGERAELLGESGSMYRASLARTPPTDGRRPDLLYQLGRTAQDLAKLTSDARYLAEAVTTFRAMVAAASEDDPKRGSRLGILGSALRAQFKSTGDRAALDEAISTYRTALAATPAGAKRIPSLSLLGHSLRDRFNQAGDIEDLRAAVQAMRLAVKAAPAPAVRLSVLEITLKELFNLTGDTALLEEAIFVGRNAVKASDGSDPERAGRLSRHGVNLRNLALYAGNLEQLKEAVAVGREAVASAVTEGRLPGYRSDLASTLRALYTETGDQDALSEAVVAAQEGVAATPAGDPDLAARLSILGGTLLEDCRRTGGKEQLAEANSRLRSAVAAAPAGHAARPGCLHALGMALGEDYERTGRVEVLLEAIQVSREAVAATTEASYHRPYRLNSLGTSLYKLYGRTGEMATLTEATGFIRVAIDTLPEGSPTKLAYLINLANCLHSLYKRTGDQAAIIEAHVLFRRAADGLPAGDRARASAQNGVGYAMRARYERGAGQDYLTGAVKAFRLAVDLTPHGNPLRDARLANLAVTLHDLYQETGDEQALGEAIDLHRTTLANADADHPVRALRATNFSIALRSLYQKTQDRAVLAEAIELSRLAAALTPADHSDRANRLHSLGIGLVDLFELTGDADALAEARTVLGQAAGDDAAPVTVRVRSGWLRSTAATLAGDFAAALAAIEGVVDLLPRLAPPGLRRHDRVHRIGEEVRGVGAQAAAAALNAGRPTRAVELLEQARGLLIAEALAARDDLSGLRNLAPDLALELVELRAEIAAMDDRPGAGGTAAEPDGSGARHTRSRGEAAESRRVVSDRWDALLARIRAVPGLEGFWAPPSADSLRPAAADCPVVIVTTHRDRCDALILDGSESSVRHVPLPGLTHEETRQQASRFRAALRNAHRAIAGLTAARQAQIDMRQTLEWLWDTTAGPVLDALAHRSPPGPDQPWPRVCWCPVGPLAALPLHAAGYHDSDDGRSVLDRVVSSYTPTVQALARLRARLPQGGPLGSPVPTLIVAIAGAPGVSPLPDVRAEVDSLRSLLPDASILDGPAATHDAVLAALPRYPVVHLACHGVTNRVFPDSSQLVLYDHGTRPLTITQIMRQELPNAGLAYLSACSTSDQNPRLIDESLHITSAFLLVGYPRVVGTLWEVADQAASRVAAQFYGYLTANGSHSPDIESTAHALHLAVRALRAEYLGQPALWASHVHVGA